MKKKKEKKKNFSLWGATYPMISTLNLLPFLISSESERKKRLSFFFFGKVNFIRKKREEANNENLKFFL